MFCRVAPRVNVIPVNTLPLPTSSPTVLDPEPDGPEARTAARLDHHPLFDAGAVLVAAYVLMSAVMLVLGVVLVHGPLGAVRSWDDHVTSWLADHRTGMLNDATKWATYVANTEGVVAVALVVSVVLLARRHWREVVLLLGGLVLEVTVFLTVNYLVERPRPDVVRLNDTPGTASFPSGHVAASLVLWVSIALIVGVLTTNRLARAVAWVPAVVLPLVIAFARVYRGMHHPTDVLAGALLALMALTAAIFAARVWTAAKARRRVPSPAELEPTALKTAGAR
jgi:membrane-associated phospholipid phosphatase